MLVILATISINTIFNGGLIDKAELAKQKALLADYEERIKIIAVDEKTGKMMDASIKDKLIDLVKVRLENEDWVGTVEKVDEEPKQLKVITTDKYIIVVEIDEDGTVKIIEEGPDDGEPYPSLKLTQEPYNEDDGATIRIKVEAEVEKTTKTKKVTTVRIVKPESMKQEKEYTEGGVIFEVTENGVYTFEAETNMGKTKRKTIEIIISKPESDIEITSKPTTPRNTKETGTQNGIEKGPINVEIKYGNNSYIKQYRKETDESWTEVNGTTASFTVTENIAIFAKYSDGTNTFKTVTYNIQNVDNESPKAFSVTETHTTNSITVGASTTDTASKGASSTIAGILRYEYRIYKNSAWQSWQTSKAFTGLTTGTYKVQAKAIDKAGNERVSNELANITLGTVSTADIKISSTPTTPRNTGTTGTQNGVAKGPITVNITYGNSSYTRQYKIGTSGSWTNVTGTTASFTVTNNTAIFARYYDGTNGFQTKGYNVQNIDNVAPKINSYNATVSKNVITATCTATDTASTGASSTTAGILRYEYSNGGSTYQTSNTFTVSNAGTYTIYMKAIDKAGNQTVVNKQVTVSSYTVTYNANGGSGAPAAQTAISGINLTLSSTVPTKSGYTFLGWSTSNTATTATYAKGATYTANVSATLYAVWKIDNVAPTTPTTSVTSRNTNTIIVNAKSTDSNGDKLTYKLYTKSASASAYTLSATSASTASGTAVNLTASNLSSYTVYTYYVTVSDGKATTTGKTVTTGTACDYTVAVSHSASYCTDGYVEVTYHTCNGTGCSCGCTAPAGQTHQHGTGNPHYCKHGIPDKHYYCDTHNITNLGSNSTCPGYITCTNSSCSGKKTLTCTNTTKVEKSCGGTLSVTGSSSDQGQTVNFTWKCSVCGTIPSLGTPNATYHDGVAHNKIITAYTCSTHNYSGSSSSHTYTTGCDHGYTSSHYYCDKHGYVGTEKTHKACGHGYIKMHYPN